MYSPVVIVFCILVFICGQVPETICIRFVTNACISVVYFLYTCYACDDVYYCFIICVCPTLTLLQVLYLTFGLHLASRLSIPNLPVVFSLQAFILRLVGKSSAHRFSVNSARV